MTLPWSCWPPCDVTPVAGAIQIGTPVIDGDPNLILYIDGAGNLAQDPSFQYVETTNTMRQISDGGDPTSILQEYKSSPTHTDTFRLQAYETTSEAEQNAILRWGWILASEGGTPGFLGFEVESRFRSGGINYQEFHFIHDPPDAVAGEPRVISYAAPGSTNVGRRMHLAVSELRLVDEASNTRASIRDELLEAHKYEDHYFDIFRLFDFDSGHDFLSVEGESVHGAGASAVFWNTSNFYIRDQADHEALTVWGPDGTAFDRVMAHRTEAAPAGGAANAGYRLGSGSMFGVFFGSGAPTMVANKGSLYLRTDGSGVADRAYIATDGAGTWTAIVTVA